jgi:DNA invertase Pin-like site-specific DNA recombinase
LSTNYPVLDCCKSNNATLVVAKLDRLARNLHFVTSLQAANVDFVCCDMPTAIHIISAIAENEALLISTRTKQALNANAFKTRRGCDFNITTVQRLYERYVEKNCNNLVFN